MILPWELAFGQRCVHVRLFRRDCLRGGDVVTDFCHTAGIDTTGCTVASAEVNRRLDEHLSDMANRVRDIFKGVHDNEFYNVMTDLIGTAAYKRGSSSHFFTLEERYHILELYRTGNEALKRRYFPDLREAPLFEAPCAKDVITLSEIEKLRAENALLTRAVFALAKRSQREGKLSSAAGMQRSRKRLVQDEGSWSSQITKPLRHARKALTRILATR
jgi:hypothetical protein